VAARQGAVVAFLVTMRGDGDRSAKTWEVEMHFNLKKNLSTTVMASLTLSAAAVAADEVTPPAAEEAIGEIVVTAQRREESISKVPLAVSAFSQGDLNKLNITNSHELNNLVPTLQVNSAFGDVQPNFSLRGIGVNNEHNPNQASPVGVYIDDAYISARVSQGLQLFDLDRIEILRGPQGTLYGRNTTGGAINFISRTPSLSGSSGNVDVGYGNYNTFTAEGAYETAIKEDISGVRFSFNYAHGDGFEKNIFPSQPAGNSTDNVAARVIYKIKPIDPLQVIIKLTAGDANPTQAGVYNLGTSVVTPTPGRPPDYNPVLQYSRTEHGLSFWQIDSDRLGYNKVKNFGSELTIKYELSDTLALTSLTSWDTANAEFTQEGTGVASPVLKQPLDTLYGNKFQMLNQEVRLSYATTATKAQAGVYYGYDKDASNSYYWLFDGLEDVHQYFDQVRKSYAVFAQWDQNLTSQLALTVGLRYTSDKAAYENYYSYVEPASVSFTGERNTAPQYWDPSAPGTAFFLGSSFVNGHIVRGPTINLNNNSPTGRLALNYTFDNGEIVYLSYNRGYRNAAFCGQCFTNVTLDTTKPEKDNAYELGTKGRFLDNRLSIATDVFWIDYSNQQTNEQIGVQSILTNVPKSRMRGIEFEGLAQLTPDIRVSLSAGYLDAKFIQLTLSEATVNGLEEPYAPKVTANLHADWRLAQFGDASVTLTPSVVYTSNVFYSPYNDLAGNAPLSQGANTKINGQLAYETSKYVVKVWGKNLTNKETFGDALDLRAFGYYYMIPLAPRTFGANFAVKF
jgi:iron complex outermembrane receptor protein